MAGACTRESPLVAGSADSYEFAARVRALIPRGMAEKNARRALAAEQFDCVHTDTLQSDEGDSIGVHESPDDPGTEFLTCDYVRTRRWGQNTQRRYMIVLYVREQRVDRVSAVTHLREVH